MLKDCVPANMFAALSQNAQEEFGLATLIGPQGPMRTIIFECSGAFKISAQQFQSMSTGEPVTVNVKNHPAFTTTKWPTHCLFIGNSKPPWEDNGFALTRRIVVFYMRKAVHHKDGLLAQRIHADTLGATLFKYSLLYRDAVAHHRCGDPLEKDPFRTDGRAVYPPTIIRFNDSVRTTMNPLFKMLYEGLSGCGEPMFVSAHNNEVFITMDAFTTQYNDYCKARFDACCVFAAFLLPCALAFFLPTEGCTMRHCTMRHCTMRHCPLVYGYCSKMPEPCAMCHVPCVTRMRCVRVASADVSQSETAGLLRRHIQASRSCNALRASSAFGSHAHLHLLHWSCLFRVCGSRKLVGE